MPATPLRDIATEADVAFFLERFYERVRKNPDLGHIFDGVAQVNWPEHMPRITAFWTSILLGTDNYRGNPMRPHFELALKTPFTPAHFDQWLELFGQTMHECFAGECADQAMIRAQSIALVMQSRLYSMGLLKTED
ncbi:hemoglobin [Rudanella paleaurantiibacter]|uniref:Hemoglobin n=1 Tax=Rudanella paleaurantiibacter TaxID=2614655 RepID=A0A7J5U583_9BACT|nr:group III truncated hemoglobin [Rudanella paleaurantiibacter]KAB7733002.1 hemoglobin [Rudanella paleaurantiibacter]